MIRSTRPCTGQIHELEFSGTTGLSLAERRHVGKSVAARVWPAEKQAVNIRSVAKRGSSKLRDIWWPDG